uniref:universal stress protein n=1 Tax=Haloprofundus sp. MHR1 TaxID=2572921 RepID=UPI001F45FDCE|nr:universal stress protein [Haloprofundus sp. MHR1]
MKRVIMPVDAEPERLDGQLATLDRLFDRADVEVTVLYVYEEIDSPADEAGKTVIESINENIESLRDAPDTVERAGTRLADDGVEASVLTTVGEPKQAIQDVAEEIDADVILIGNSRRTPVGKAVFGSVTQGIILEGDRPVLVAN